jgi:epoxyqueuosine reductase QueG
MGLLAMHLLQTSMVYVNTLTIQEVLASPEWSEPMAPPRTNVGAPPRKEASMDPRHFEQELLQAVTAFVRQAPGNAMAAHDGMRMYDDPLLAVASADDPWFARFPETQILGETFLQPQHWLAGCQSIIAYFLPFTQELRATNKKPGLPSEAWVSARIDGEAFNQAVRTFLVDLLAQWGARACAPCLDPRFKVTARVANWSERHVAMVAGLGTFGLHRALITAKGSAGRLGSVVTTLAMPATPRPYTRHDEYCPSLNGGRCGACIRRCPPEAISSAGKNHALCSDYIDREILPRFWPRYGCAKCNISVPCESGIPGTGRYAAGT